ncbi:MAG: septal ring lytic transglycosylase RlpA family protein [Prevotella sp.]|nr:septal ring lytic transglycosylase RlpA family protein [Prevotella sp.]
MKTTILILLLLSNSLVSMAQQRGYATYYAQKFNGTKTASGQRLDNNAFVCAHKTHPFGTKLQVKNLSTGKTVVVTVIDRGPFVKGYIIDLSQRAAHDLGIIKHGRAKVEVSPIGKKHKNNNKKKKSNDYSL